MKDFIIVLEGSAKNSDSIFENAFVQMVLNVILTGIVLYFLLRRYKRNDDFLIEKNKRLVEKYVDCESQLFDMMNTVKTTSISSEVSIDLSNRMNNFKILNYLYISEELMATSKEFSDYLLEISVDPIRKDVKIEDKLIKEFKSKFKK